MVTPAFSLNSESQTASGAVQDGLELRAHLCESLAFYERSAARRRPPESQEAALRAHTLIKTILSPVYE